MIARLKSAMLALLLLVSLAGCRGPTELFSYIDRHCFVADWCNDHSCLSCSHRANCSSGPTMPLHERTLDLPTDTEHHDTGYQDAEHADVQQPAAEHAAP